MSRNLEHHQLNFRHLPFRFIKSAAWSIPIYATITALILSIFTLIVFQGEFGNRWWHSLTRWSVTVIAVFFGLAGGGLFGLLSAAKKTVGEFHEQLRAWFEQLPPESHETEKSPRSIQEVRAHYESLLERALSATVGRILLPGFLDRLVRSKLRQAVVEDFIDSLAQRGVTQVAPQNFRNWVLTKGLSLGLEPTYNQLAFWRYLIAGVIGLFLAGLLGIAYLSQ